MQHKQFSMCSLHTYMRAHMLHLNCSHTWRFSPCPRDKRLMQRRTLKLRSTWIQCDTNILFTHTILHHVRETSLQTFCCSSPGSWGRLWWRRGLAFSLRFWVTINFLSLSRHTQTSYLVRRIRANAAGNQTTNERASKPVVNALLRQEGRKRERKAFRVCAHQVGAFLRFSALCVNAQ